MLKYNLIFLFLTTYNSTKILELLWLILLFTDFKMRMKSYYRALFICVLVPIICATGKQSNSLSVVNTRTFLADTNFTNHTTKVSDNFYSGERYESHNVSSSCRFSVDKFAMKRNQSLKVECCDTLYTNFKKSWHYSMNNLVDMLRALKAWNCSQLKEECSKLTFAYTDYTKLVYSRFCNASHFVHTCKLTLSSAIKDLSKIVETEKGILRSQTGEAEEFFSDGSGEMSFSSIESSGDNDFVTMEKISIKHLREDLLPKEMITPCVQSAMIDVESMTSGILYEIKENQVAFCDIVWCSFPASYYRDQLISHWTCMPKKCRVNIYVMMALAGLLGFIIVLLNGTVLTVFATTKRLRNSQGIYKISLAAADLLVGVFVFPTFIDTMRRALMTPYILVDGEKQEDSWGNAGNGTRLQLQRFTVSYYNFCGFFTTLSLTVSVYTLMTASFDRFMVVYRPLEYNQFAAKKTAKLCCLVLWVVGIAFSLLPLVVPDITFMRIASVLVVLGGGMTALIIYTIALAIPLILVWVMNIATFMFSKRNAKVRPKIRNHERGTIVNLENRLAKTLSIMVGVFTLCTLPVATITISEFFIAGIYYGRPETLDTYVAKTVISLEVIAAFILMSNSMWNFFIYSARSMEFRAASRGLYSKLVQKGRAEFCCRIWAKDLGRNRNHGSVYSSSQNTVSNKRMTISTRVQGSVNAA